MPDETVAEVAELYLGNILYAIELAALSLDRDGKATDAAFYRACVLFDAHMYAEALADLGRAELAHRRVSFHAHVLQQLRPQLGR